MVLAGSVYLRDLRLPPAGHSPGGPWRRGGLVGFLELQRQCGVSHEVLRGAQGASHVPLGKSGLHAHCEALEKDGNPLQYSCLENPRDRGA